MKTSKSILWDLALTNHWLYTVVVVVGILLSGYTHGISIVIACIAVLLYSRFFKKTEGEKPLKRWSKAELIDTLKDTRSRLELSQEANKVLRDNNARLHRTNPGDELTTKLIALVGAHLTAYDNQGGRISAEATLSHLRDAMKALGADYHENSTRHFTPRQWEDFYASVREFERR